MAKGCNPDCSRVPSSNAQAPRFSAQAPFHLSQMRQNPQLDYTWVPSRDAQAPMST
ncbi:hypothetical protein COLO4_06477 [Corchorus olitorius]|uniref:Uncharacterized protein n=1 Tax=Corchorus olitorius TaxID=93759 RepID=A0A1R3KN02_9ROSI|nr:hypothetical protein COLO4_06477 [Corchorus olitorius]